ncbi:MAG: amidohydrolase [Rhodospirillaceae bacterium]|nr:amidohydrolase [Rhodospirillaceae bacterium]
MAYRFVEQSRRLGAIVVLGVSLAGPTVIGQAPPPDAIYVNGKIVTVDDNFTILQAFAVRGEKFVGVADNAAIRKLAGPSTRVIDLGGRTVVPGFIDTHAHTMNGHAIVGRTELGRVSLLGVKSVTEAMKRVGDAAAKAAPGEWIVTTGMGDPPDFLGLPEDLAENRWPMRADLDKVAPNNPVYLFNAAKQPYPSTLNSVALKLIGVDRNTADQGRVRIMRDVDGEPNGLIYGFDRYSRAFPLYQKLQSLLPTPTPEQQVEAARNAFLDNIAVGVTTIYEGHGSLPERVKNIRTLRAAGDLKNRVVLAYDVPQSKPLPEIEAWMKGLTEARGSGSGDDIFKIVGVTISFDGATQHGGALMYNEYLDSYRKLGNGTPELSIEKVVEIGRLAMKYNLRLNTIAAGNKACALVAEAYEMVDRETPIKDRRWVVQHFQHPTPEVIAKLKRMGVVATTYSSADFSKGLDVYVNSFPNDPHLWKSTIPLRWWIDGGVPIAQSTDGAHYEPMFTIWESLVRVDGRTDVSLLAPPKQITREEAIRIYTINGAKVIQWEDKVGSIESDKYADFVVLEKDILTVPVEEIRDTKVLMTAIGGNVVHSASPFSSAPR